MGVFVRVSIGQFSGVAEGKDSTEIVEVIVADETGVLVAVGVFIKVSV